MNIRPGLLLIVLTAAALRAEAPKPTIGAVLQPFVDRHEIAGAVTLAATKDKVLDVSAVGYLDVAAKTPMKEDAMFWIASMSKAMTASAVMMLVDEGKIKLDDPVEKYLPEFKGQQVAMMKDGKQTGLKAPVHPITVRNVLSHTSGLPFKSPEETPTLDGKPLKDAVKTYAALALQFEPDSAYQYSNAGINTAARILEVVSGMAYEDFMQNRLFGPLGMKDTTFWPNQEHVSRLAKSYKANAAKNDLEETTITQLQYPLTDHQKRFPMPAGGLFSTARDSASFCQMLLNKGAFNGHQILSAAAVKEMTSRQTAPSIKQAYGFGLSVSAEGYGHGGAYATNMNVDTARGLVTVFMVQQSGAFPGRGKEASGAFGKAAKENFGLGSEKKN